MASSAEDISMKHIGCCGAYCKTCPALINKSCRGCKLGYDAGERDISKAKCEMKVCCIKQNYKTCADCPDYPNCQIIQSYYNKNGYKYTKYRQALEFIRENGYTKFIKISEKWKNAYGKY
ncbi:MAG TPA: DUF3795 domain-containing protein [Methanofastidiosum sp.]|nr:DUF3795 domain-containing protein [Methanofastidiosum sp.]HNU61530.1 DUF3795 domain-containing protein [Methanofastidiosum sp.]HOI76853.1 DUF3795 domain-containing protein [Methanofastidiosum sp.]